MRLRAVLGFGIAAVILSAPSAYATPFDFIRIGDVDGFGFTNTSGLQRTTGAAADTNGNNLLEATEFLPDINHDGAVATGRGDDFDHRSNDEKNTPANTIFGNGFSDLGSTGAKWTDISLSTSFCTTFPNATDFPDGSCPNGDNVPNEPEFLYKFHVNGGDISTSAVMFFNVLFGDYDVSPANITLSFASAASRTIALNTQASAADGLIQAAFASLAFSEVFTDDGSGGWNGYVKVNFVAPNEPYTAFDFTELSTTPISQEPVPEPASLALFGSGVLGLVARARRRKKA